MMYGCGACPCKRKEDLASAEAGLSNKKEEGVMIRSDKRIT